jgi:hypothetical protein
MPDTLEYIKTVSICSKMNIFEIVFFNNERLLYY